MLMDVPRREYRSHRCTRHTFWLVLNNLDDIGRHMGDKEQDTEENLAQLIHTGHGQQNTLSQRGLAWLTENITPYICIVTGFSPAGVNIDMAD